MVEKLKSAIKKRSPLFVLSSILLIIFYTFSFFVKEDFFTQFDFDMTVKIQNFIPVRFDPHFSALSLIGSFEITLIILGVYAVVRRKVGGIIVLGLFCFMHFVELVGKLYLDHPGTPFMFHRYAFDFVFPTGYVQPGGSYPSGHAMRTAFLSVVFIHSILTTKKISMWIPMPPGWIQQKFWTLFFFKKHVLIIPIVLIYIAMAVSRVSLGEHWTTDVIGGSLLGAAFAILSLVFI